MKGYLILENGQTWSGQWHGNEQKQAIGEVVFNTSMLGYQEILTDPSYYQQIVVMTAPEQGNYGVAEAEMESERIWAQGFVCVNMNSAIQEGRGQLSSELNQYHVPALSQINTRQLTLHLREKGTPWGALVSEPDFLKLGQEKILKLIADHKNSIDSDWVYHVSQAAKSVHQGKGNKGRVALLDYGYKKSILNQLLERFQEVAVYNSRTPATEILKWAPNGIVLSNGPGDPGEVQKAVGEIKSLLGKVPLFGICMGHQLLALAMGAKTYKLKFGHRGGNHPVQNFETGEIYMTSQNHGYAVSSDLPADVVQSQINLYDKTLEGIESKKWKAWGVQYHPEAGPGPHDSRVLFNHFSSKIL